LDDKELEHIKKIFDKLPKQCPFIPTCLTPIMIEFYHSHCSIKEWVYCGNLRDQTPDTIVRCLPRHWKIYNEELKNVNI